MAPYLTLGFVLAGLMHAFVPRKMVAKHLGDESVASSVKGAVVGVPLPLCSCGVIPTGIGMRKRGRKSCRDDIVSDLDTAGPEWIRFLLLTASSDGSLPSSARLRHLSAGSQAEIAVLLFGKKSAADEHWMKFHQPAEDALQDKREKQPLGRKLIEGGRFAFIDLFGDIALWLVIGILIAAGISLAVTEGVLLGDDWSGIACHAVDDALRIARFMFVRTASVPIAAVLMTKGISAGAAFVFLMDRTGNKRGHDGDYPARDGKPRARTLLRFDCRIGAAVRIGTGLSYRYDGLDD